MSCCPVARPCFQVIFELMTKELTAFAPSTMKVHQSECPRYGPSHLQQMWISKGGFEPSRRPQEVHCIFTFVFFSIADTDLH